MATFMKLVVLVTMFSKISCDCVENYKTVCDKLADVKKYRTDSWGELLIGDLRYIEEIPDNTKNNRIPSLNEKFFGNVANIYSLTIINQLNTVWMDHDYPGLDYINLYKNNLRVLSLHSFAHFVHLRTLILKDNNIAKLVWELSSSSMKVLDLSRNNLEFLGPGLFSNSTLTWINLKSNELSRIAEKPFPATLKILNLDFNQLRHFGEDVIENLENLQELTLSNNKIFSMPQLKHLKSVNLLDLSRNEITILIDNFSSLKNLTYLDLSSNKILRMERLKFVNNSYTNTRISLAYNRLPGLSYLDISNLFGHSLYMTNNTLSIYGNPLYCGCLNQMLYYFRASVNITMCDQQFFNNGETPSCVAQAGNCEREEIEINLEDYHTFINSVLKGEKNVPCNLIQDFYRDRIAFVPRKNFYD